jgi:hypothetical protein
MNISYLLHIDMNCKRREYHVWCHIKITSTNSEAYHHKYWYLFNILHAETSSDTNVYNHMIYLSLFPYYSYFQFNVLSLVLLLSRERESLLIYSREIIKGLEKHFMTVGITRKTLYAHFISIQMLKSYWKFTFKRLHNFFHTFIVREWKAFMFHMCLWDMNAIPIWRGKYLCRKTNFYPIYSINTV